MSNEVKSPCVNICRLKSGICLGCFRSSKEITEWYNADAHRKLEIIQNAEQRKKDFEAA
jgi:predicted Fe-S protein YdhL (DUF1289 family)